MDQETGLLEAGRDTHNLNKNEPLRPEIRVDEKPKEIGGLAEKTKKENSSETD